MHASGSENGPSMSSCLFSMLDCAKKSLYAVFVVSVEEYTEQTVGTGGAIAIPPERVCA